MVNKVIEDLQWFYKTLDIGGKTPEFYEAQKDIILQAIAVLNKQTEKQIRAKTVEDLEQKLRVWDNKANAIPEYVWHCINEVRKYHE